MAMDKEYKFPESDGNRLDMSMASVSTAADETEGAISSLLNGIKGIGDMFINAMAEVMPSIDFEIPDGQAKDDWFRGVVCHTAIKNSLDTLPEGPQLMEALEFLARTGKQVQKRLLDKLFWHLANDFSTDPEVLNAIQRIAPIDQNPDGQGFQCYTRQPKSDRDSPAIHLAMLNEEIPERVVHGPSMQSLIRGSAADLTETAKGDEFFTARSKFNKIQLKTKFIIHKAADDRPEDLWGSAEIEQMVDRLNFDFKEFGIEFKEQDSMEYNIEDLKLNVVVKTTSSSDKRFPHGKYVASKINEELKLDTTELIVIHILRNFMRPPPNDTKKPVSRVTGCGGEAAFPYSSAKTKAKWGNASGSTTFQYNDWSKSTYMTQIDEGCLLSPWVVSHEVGHMLGLHHPFQPLESPSYHRFIDRYKDNHVPQQMDYDCTKFDPQKGSIPQDIDFWNIMNYYDCGTQKTAFTDENQIMYIFNQPWMLSTFTTKVDKKFTPGQADRARRVMRDVESEHKGAFGLAKLNDDYHDNAEERLAYHIVNKPAKNDGDLKDLITYWHELMSGTDKGYHLDAEKNRLSYWLSELEYYMKTTSSLTQKEKEENKKYMYDTLVEQAKVYIAYLEAIKNDVKKAEDSEKAATVNRDKARQYAEDAATERNQYEEAKKFEKNSHTYQAILDISDSFERRKKELMDNVRTYKEDSYQYKEAMQKVEELRSKADRDILGIHEAKREKATYHAEKSLLLSKLKDEKEREATALEAESKSAKKEADALRATYRSAVGLGDQLEWPILDSSPQREPPRDSEIRLKQH